MIPLGYRLDRIRHDCTSLCRLERIPGHSVSGVTAISTLPTLRSHTFRLLYFPPSPQLRVSPRPNSRSPALSCGQGVRALCHRRAGPTKTSDACYIWGGSACDEWPPVHDRLHAVAGLGDRG